MHSDLNDIFNEDDPDDPIIQLGTYATASILKDPLRVITTEPGAPPTDPLALDENLIRPLANKVKKIWKKGMDRSRKKECPDCAKLISSQNFSEEFTRMSCYTAVNSAIRDLRKFHR